MTWTATTVLERLIESYAVIEAVTKRVRPNGYGNSHPEMMLDTEDRYTGANLDEIELAMKEASDDRATVVARSISRALEAQRWPVEMIENQDRREVLIQYATCKARNGNWSEYVQHRNRRNPTKKAWVRQKTYERMNRAAQEIAAKLNKDAQLLHDPDDLQSGQISRTSDFVDDGTQRVTHWRAPDAKPLGNAATNKPDIYTIPKPRKRKAKKRAR